MFINQQKLMHLPVFTQSGVKLGTIHDMEIDVETHQIRRYIVVHGLITKDRYLVTPTQVISITADQVIVEDTIMKDPGVAPEAGPAAPNPALGGMSPILKQ